MRQWPHDQSSNPCKYKFTSLNYLKFWKIVNCEVGIILQKIKIKKIDLWKLSQIESKHTQVDLKILMSPSPHTVRYLNIHVLFKFPECSHFYCSSKTWMNFHLKADVLIRSGLLLIGSGVDFRIFVLLQGWFLFATLGAPNTYAAP